MIAIKQDELLKPIMPIYVVCDPGNYWGVTVESRMVKDLSMKPMDGDLALFYKKNGNGLQGLSDSYIYIGLHTSNEHFEKLPKNTLARFESKPRLYDSFDFFGTQIETFMDGFLYAGQPYYAKNFTLATNDTSYECFRSMQALFSWMSHTRPDPTIYTNRAAQITENTFGPDKIRKLQKGIGMLNLNVTAGLLFWPKNENTHHLCVYANASSAINDDLSIQVVYFIFLCDYEVSCHILGYSSKKSHRVVRSIMGGEIYAFMDAVDAAFIISRNIQSVLRKFIPIYMFTDYEQPFDAMTEVKQTTEKRLMINISSAHQSCKSFEICRIGLISGTQNPSDPIS